MSTKNSFKGKKFKHLQKGAVYYHADMACKFMVVDIDKDKGFCWVIELSEEGQELLLTETSILESEYLGTPGLEIVSTLYGREDYE